VLEATVGELPDLPELPGKTTLGDDTQLRLDHHGRWHPYTLIDGAWTPKAPATTDPLAALADDW